MTGYYDLVLALIPMALVGIGGVLLVAGVPLHLAVSLAGVTAVGMVGHAIFVNGPVARPRTVPDTEPKSGSANAGHAVQAD